MNDLNIVVLENLFPLRGRLICEEVVFIPRKRRKVLFGRARHHLGEILRALAWQKECQILEGHLMPDHVHMCIAIPPKYAVSAVIGRIEQYTASWLWGKFAWLGKVYWKERVVLSPGYFVSTVGLNEKQIAEYVRWQAHQDSGQAKLGLF